jgi:hypothetical protein
MLAVIKLGRAGILPLWRGYITWSAFRLISADKAEPG